MHDKFKRFHSDLDSHNSSTFVYRVDKEELKLVQTIPSSGPIRLSISTVKEDYFLAIANNRDPMNNSCLTNSAIYKWSTRTHKFILLQKVRTNGALDVIFLEAKDRVASFKGAFLNFVAFAQSGNSGDGEVLILQFDKKQQNYVVVQSLRTKWSITGMDFLCVQENCYLVIVVPQEGVHFYEYRYVEVKIPFSLYFNTFTFMLFDLSNKNSHLYFRDFN